MVATSRLLPSGRFYETEQPIILTYGEPEPDGIVIIGSPFDPRLIKPRPSEFELVIEVLEQLLPFDRGIKLRNYARAGIQCYWIVNLIDRQVEIYTRADWAAETPNYTLPSIFRFGVNSASHWQSGDCDHPRYGHHSAGRRYYTDLRAPISGGVASSNTRRLPRISKRTN